MNILLVEDSIMIRAQMTSVLSAICGIKVVGHASTEDDAVGLIASIKPDVVLMDYSLESGTGLNVLTRMRQAGSVSRVIMLTNHTASHLRRRCMEMGAQNYFDKSTELVNAISQIKQWLNPADGACQADGAH